MGEIRFKNKTFALIDASDVGKKYSFSCIIADIKQTSGPTIFELSDGTAVFKATGFVKPGARAFPELEKEDCIKTDISIKERHGILEGEIESYIKLGEKDCKKLKDKIQQKKEDKSKTKQSEFIIDSPVLEKLKPKIIAASDMIRKAIFENRQIIVRHHDDCDGYASAVALDRAIRPMIENQHRSQYYKYYRRYASRSPYYDYIDCIKDISTSKNPLLILCDLGDADENLMSVKKAGMYGANIVLIDHHSLANDELEKLVDIIINPYLVGYDNNFVSGMLCAELARFINIDVKEIDYLPALAGTGDKSEGPEYEKYLGISGKSKEYLEKWALCIDFETSYLRYFEAEEIVDDLFSISDKQEKLIGLLYPEIKKRIDETIATVNKYKKVEQKGVKLIWVHCDEIDARGEFPNPSKIVSITHQTESGPRITTGYMRDLLIFRADMVRFDVNTLVAYLQKKYPYAQVKGGGHEYAGAIKYVAAASKEIFAEVKSYLAKVTKS